MRGSWHSLSTGEWVFRRRVGVEFIEPHLGADRLVEPVLDLPAEHFFLALDPARLLHAFRDPVGL
jgi:hypothetical protein